MKADWKDIKNHLRQDGFIQSIMDFDRNAISVPVKTFVVNNYLKDTTTFNVEKIQKASSAAGPLALWVKSIIEYSEIFHKIAPLRELLKQLEAEEALMKTNKQALDDEIVQLDRSIEGLQEDYAELMGTARQLEQETVAVQEKVNRSVALITNLSSERARWEESSKSFVDQMSCLLGDCLFASGFLTYIGFFDHYYRRYLQVEWRDAIDQVSLKMRHDLKFTEFLSKPSERLEWEKQELPSDELCVENAIIMKHYNRYPLVIDPSDQALKFIVNHYSQGG